MVLEIITPTFFIFWFGIGGIAASITAYFVGNTIWELTTFIIVSGILVVLTRPLVNKMSGEQPRKINIDEIIGKRALVIEEIDNKAGKGVVKVNGDTWRAYSQKDDIKIKKGEHVKVLQVEGAHLIVEREEEEKES
ncbi:NfeD family protein [Thermosipho atlanticus]|uniref:Membrane protein implicated in regulation of membrane protease activity n=1 Tax=Thermosipho atlanticus DSM 15807 TaxID=1123380 RepID=A0A1M5QSP5_9BACT|nr:NfeD family protein [Thermosipho atlanticus]SHH16613.1 Membrane protein implicated in regulation of membrane protease activity [Thermosipho atlanticus DSM 15807]